MLKRDILYVPADSGNLRSMPGHGQQSDGHCLALALAIAQLSVVPGTATTFSDQKNFQNEK